MTVVEPAAAAKKKAVVRGALAGGVSHAAAPLSCVVRYCHVVFVVVVVVVVVVLC